MTLVMAMAAIAIAAEGASAVESKPKPMPCSADHCRVELTPEQLLSIADRLVSARRFKEAQPYLDALKHVPSLTMEREFLEGFVAVETGDLPLATKKFRSVLAARPDLTRARLELARALMLQGKDRAAEYHFRLAEEDRGLSDEIRRTVYAARSVIRGRERWSFRLGLGLAPDTNINSATNDRTVDVLFGDVSIPFVLDPDTRRNTGIGQTMTVAAQGRVPVSHKLAFLGRLDGYGVNYDGKFADDASILIAIGPEVSPTDRLRFRLEGLGGRRWYGGRLATRQAGVRLSGDKLLSRGGSIGAEAEARHNSSPINSGFDGWSYSLRVTHERVIGRSMFASTSAFARRDALANEAYSNSEFGLMAGIGGEMPHGLNLGASAQLSHARYDDPLRALNPDPRDDWRVSTRLYIASRRLRIGDFAPSISYGYTRNASNISLYDFSRHRVELQFTRVF